MIAKWMGAIHKQQELHVYKKGNKKIKIDIVIPITFG